MANNHVVEKGSGFFLKDETRKVVLWKLIGGITAFWMIMQIIDYTYWLLY